MAGFADLREAITATGGGASPLVPKLISPILLELVRKYAPLRIAFPTLTWDTDTYFWNNRSSLPQAQFVTEVPPLTGVGSVTPTNSVYNQLNYVIKHFQSQGDVSLFAQKVARVNGSLLDLEIDGATRAMGWLEDLSHLFGSVSATVNTKRPAWDGLRLQTALANRIDAQTIGANGVLTLPMLDALIDVVRTPLAAHPAGDDYFFVMSPRMETKIGQLTQQNGRFLFEKRAFKPMTDGGELGAPVVVDNVDPGVEVYGYRNIPIILSSFLQCVGQMSAVAASQAAGTTPFLINAVRNYQMTAVTIYGETLASTELVVTVAVAANSVTLTWSTPTITDPATGAILPIFCYYLWESVNSGKETLLAVIPAFDAGDNPVTSFTDLGVASTGTAVFYQVGAAGDGVTFPNQFISGNANGFGSENIYLVTRDPNFIVVPRVNDINAVLLALTNPRSRQFALTADETLAVRAPAFISSLQRCRWA